jgi:hypothetical protein
MPSHLQGVVFRVSRAIYRALLYAYPSEFRTRYGTEMCQVFSEQLRETLSAQRPLGFLQFCIHTVLDLTISILKERFTLQNAIGTLCLAAAATVGIGAAYVDRHNTHETYPTLLVVLVGSFILGLIRPQHAWRWALLAGLGVPFLGPVVDLPLRLLSPGCWAMLAVVLVPGLTGAYTGSTLHRAMQWREKME